MSLRKVINARAPQNAVDSYATDPETFQRVDCSTSILFSTHSGPSSSTIVIKHQLAPLDIPEQAWLTIHFSHTRRPNRDGFFLFLARFDHIERIGDDQATPASFANSSKGVHFALDAAVAPR